MKLGVRWIAMLTASVMLVGCSGSGSEPTEFTGTVICQPVEQDTSGTEFQVCQSEASDDRVTGTIIVTYTSRETETWEATVASTGDEGSWSGTMVGTREGPAGVNTVELEGDGGYDGLTVTLTATLPVATHDGSGVSELVGVVEESG